MSLASLARLGLSYTKTGLNYAGKTAKVLIHESIGDGYSVISQGRKAAGKAAGKGYTVFQGFGTKTKAGWDVLKKDIAATANKPGIFAKAKAHYNIGVTAASAGKKLNALQKLAAGSKSIATAIGTSIKTAWKSGASAAATGKYLSKLGKTGKILGGLKGLAKPLCKMPMLVAIGTAIFEGPKIYDAFKNGGFIAGIKETGKVCAGLAVGGALGALGTVAFGPIGGMIGYMAGEQITRSLLGESEETVAETKENDELAQAQENGLMPEDPTPAVTTEETEQQESQPTETSEEPQQGNQPQQGEQQTQTQSELPATLQASDTSYQPQPQLSSNPYAQGYTPYSNPFGFDAGTNIFQRYPMGFTFQYQGNNFGMMA